MKKRYLIFLTIVLLFLFIAPAQAQRGFINSMIKEKVQEDMKEKYAEPEREKGKKALEDVTYENDSRFPTPENAVQATLVMEMKSFKKNGTVNETNTSKIVFGKTGECMVINEGEKNETRMLFDYEGAATYMVNVKEKTAMKMPMINFEKMAEKMASMSTDVEDDSGKWTRTNEEKEINGYNCRKYIYTNEDDKTKVDAWVTQEISIDLSGNHLFGGQIKDFSKNASMQASSKLDENLPRGLMVRSIYFEKNSNTPNMQMDIITFEKTFDPAYFDLSGYEVMDILGKL